LKDRRSLRISITQRGKTMLKKSAKSTQDLAEKIISALSDQELSTFTTLMVKIQKKSYEHRNIANLVKEIRL